MTGGQLVHHRGDGVGELAGVDWRRDARTLDDRARVVDDTPGDLRPPDVDADVEHGAPFRPARAARHPRV